MLARFPQRGFKLWKKIEMGSLEVGYLLMIGDRDGNLLLVNFFSLSFFVSEKIVIRKSTMSGINLQRKQKLS